MPSVAPAIPFVPSPSVGPAAVGASASGRAAVSRPGQDDDATTGFDTLLKPSDTDCRVAPPQEPIQDPLELAPDGLAGCAVCVMPPILDPVTLPSAQETSADAASAPLGGARAGAFGPALLTLLQGAGKIGDAADKSGAAGPVTGPGTDPVDPSTLVADAAAADAQVAASSTPTTDPLKLSSSLAAEATSPADLSPPKPSASRGDKTASRLAPASDSLFADAQAPAPGAQPSKATSPASSPASLAADRPFDAMLSKDADGAAPAKSVDGALGFGQAAGASADSSATAQTAAAAPAASRASAETTAALAAQIVRKLEGRSTRFDVALTPEGLGRVDVTVRIAHDGALSAAFAFDQAQSAADVGARAADLRQALAQAGFDVARDALTFTGGDGRQSGGFARQDGDRRAAAAPGFDAILAGDIDLSGPAAAASASRSLRLGLDLRV